MDYTERKPRHAAGLFVFCLWFIKNLHHNAAQKKSRQMAGQSNRVRRKPAQNS
jgi:hypothetical protein